MERKQESYAWRVLLIDDDEGDYFIVREMLSIARREKFLLEWAPSYHQGLKLLSSQDDYDAVLVDYDLGSGTGIQLVQEALAAGCQAPILLLTGRGSFDVDVEAMEAGAADYLSKQEMNPALLERSLRYSIERKQVEAVQRRNQAELRASEMALRSSEERYRLATRAVFGILYDWNVETGEILRSEGLERVTGYRAEEVPQDMDWWGSLIHPDDRERTALEIREILSGSYETFESEYRIRHRDGHWVYLWDRSFIDRGPDGRPRRVLGVSSDITQRKHLELAVESANLELARANLGLAQVNADLRESEGRFRLALASAPVSVFSHDLDLRYTWMFRSEREAMIDDRQILGKRDDELMPREDAADLVALKRHVLETGEKVQREIKLRLRDQVFSFLMVLEPQIGPDGKVKGLTGAAMDITELRRLESWQLEHATHTEVHRRLLEQREMERQQIARDLHDGPIQELMGLLFSIQAAVGMTQEPEMSQVLEEMAESARGLANTLRGVCNELRPPTLMQFGLSRAIQSHIDDYATRNPNLHIDLDLVDDSRDIPDGVRLALFRIFQESLTNIHKHAQANQLTTRLRMASGKVLLEIEDDGCGFEPPNDWLALARDGHLGLVGMKERCEAIGGQFEVRSRPERGTIIRVTAPLEENAVSMHL